MNATSNFANKITIVNGDLSAIGVAAAREGTRASSLVVAQLATGA